MKYEYKGFTIHIERDDDPIDPRVDFDNLGTMVLFHRQMCLGDKDHGYISDNYNGWIALEEDIFKNEDPAVCLSVYGYSHGGLTISTSPFSDPWDSGQLGFIFISKEKVRKEYGWNRLTRKRLQKIEEYLRDEIRTYDQFLTGDVWGFIIESAEDPRLDSCWGFYGHDYCKKEAEDAVDYLMKKEKAATAELQRVQAAMPCCLP